MEVVKLMGLWPVSFVDTARSMLLVAILFAGPLFEQGIVDRHWKHWIQASHLQETLSSWMGYRNYVVVGFRHLLFCTPIDVEQGPVSEEIIWRSMVIPLHILANISGKNIVFITPLYFGIAHLHHLYEFRLTHPHTPMLLAIFRSLFQFTYTSLFGFFAAFVFLRTGNVWSAILAHSFCNWLGLPRFWGRVGVEAGVPIGPPGIRKRSDEDTDEQEDDFWADGSKGMIWTVAYYVILTAGAYGFYRGLFPLTESSNALVKLR
jgi:prenyl protein peptidase